MVFISMRLLISGHVLVPRGQMRECFIKFILQTASKINVKSYHRWAALLFFVFTYTWSDVVCVRVSMCLRLLLFCVSGARTWLVSCPGWTRWGVGCVIVGVPIGCCAHWMWCLGLSVVCCSPYPAVCTVQFSPFASEVCIVWVCPLSPQFGHPPGSLCGMLLIPTSVTFWMLCQWHCVYVINKCVTGW